MYGSTESAGEPVDHGPVVAAIASFLRPSIYVELGAAQAATFRQVSPRVARAVAVEIAAENAAHFVGIQNGEFWCGDTRDWLRAQPDESIDLAFLDSSHEFQQTIDECILLHAKVRPNGVILLHDAYPPNRDYCASGYCGEVYRAIPILKQNLGWEGMTLPAQYGLALFRKHGGRQLLWK